MALFAPKCPVSLSARDWIETSLEWLGDEFGRDALMGEVFVPQTLFSSETFAGTEDDLHRTVEVICTRMGVATDEFDLAIVDSEVGEMPDLGGVPQMLQHHGAAGHFRRVGGRSIVSIRRSELDRPVALAATIAHEIGHVRLLGEGRVSPDRPDGEQLTDLTAVFFGFGVFSANAAFDYSRDSRGWRSSTLGYLGERLLAFGLACCAFRRGEQAPAWATALDTNPRVYLKQGLRYLERRSSS